MSLISLKSDINVRVDVSSECVHENIENSEKYIHLGELGVVDEMFRYDMCEATETTNLAAMRKKLGVKNPVSARNRPPPTAEGAVLDDESLDINKSG